MVTGKYDDPALACCVLMTGFLEAYLQKPKAHSQNHGIIGVHRPPLNLGPPFDTKAPGTPLIYLVGPLGISDNRINICVDPQKLALL